MQPHSSMQGQSEYSLVPQVLPVIRLGTANNPSPLAGAHVRVVGARILQAVSHNPRAGMNCPRMSQQDSVHSMSGPHRMSQMIPHRCRNSVPKVC